MTVVAVTLIRFGADDGKVTEFGIGEAVTGLADDQLKALVEGGSAVETGDKKKFNSPYYNARAVPLTSEQEDTLKRDALIAGLVPAEQRPAGDGSTSAPSLVGQQTSVDVELARAAEAQRAAAAKAAADAKK